MNFVSVNQNGFLYWLPNETGFMYSLFRDEVSICLAILPNIFLINS